jgi:O-antigen/teichoic acid export membrane protein
MQETLSSSRVVVHNAMYNLVGYAVSALYVFFLIPIIVRFIGVEQFGLWSLMLALTGYIGLADLGLSTSFVKYIAEYVSVGDSRRVNQVIRQGLLFYVLLSVVVLVAGYFLFPLAFSILRIPSVKYDLSQMCFLTALATFGVSNIAGVFGSILNGIQRSDVFNMLVAILLPLKFAASFVVLALGYGLIGLMTSDLVVSAGTIIPLVWMTKKHFPQFSLTHIPYDNGLMKVLLRFGAQLQVSRFAELVQFQFDKMLLSRFIGLPAVSLYDFGSRPLARLRALPITAIASLVPAVSALDAVHERARIQAALIRSTRYLVVLTLPCFAFIVCFAHELVAVWLGPGFDQAATTMQILAIGYAISVGAMTLALVSQGMGQPKYQMHATIVQAILNIVLSTTLVLTFGYFGAVVGTTVSIIVGASLFYYWFGKQLMDHPIAAIVTICSKPLASIVPAVLIGLGIRFAWRGDAAASSRLEMLVFVIVMTIVFFCVYAAMIYVSRTFTHDDKGFVASVLPGRLKYFLKFL